MQSDGASPAKEDVLPYATAEQAEPPKGAMGTIFLVALVDMLGFGLVIPLLPFYARQFQASPLQVTLLFSIFSICQFLATPILGGWSDRIGRRPILLVSLVGNAIGYALLGWATMHQWHSLALGLLTVYLSRIIAGLTSGNISAAQAYISDITTPKNRTRGMGMLGAAFGIGFSVGPAVGGILAHYAGPSSPAWLAAVLASAAAVFCRAKLVEVQRNPAATPVNYLHPSVFKPLLANRPLMKLNASWFLAMGAFVAADSAIVMFLNDVMKYQEKQVAYYFLLVGVVIILTQGGLVGRLSKRYGEWGLCTTGLMLNGVGAVLTATLAWHQSLTLLVTSAIFAAFGRSLFQPTISALVSHHSDREQQGLSFGFFQAMGTLARVFGPIAAGVIYMRHITWPWFLGALTLAMTALWLLRIRAREKAEAPVPVMPETSQH